MVRPDEVAFLCGLFISVGCAAGGADSDGDGLTDFQEEHKYLTNPAKRDTDGDGVPDGDWNERREYAYTVRTILQFMPPFDETALNDDYQDARVLEARDDYIEMEVIHYPLATAHKSIKPNPNWQRDDAGMSEYLKAGITTNWDARMRRNLIKQLRADGIVIDRLTDVQVVTKVARWLMKRSRALGKVFTTYYIHFPNGRPAVYPGLGGAFTREFHRDSRSYDWSINQHLDHELLGRGMFYNRTYGSCTSFAIYLTTALRAIGIPTRMIIVVPAVDPSDPRQLRLVPGQITHNKVRGVMLDGLRRIGRGFVAHTFNEVYVGKRWCRLNYSQLGQPVLDRHLFGLHTHLYTFSDLSEANLAATWGLRYGNGERTAVFGHSNPYATVALSDRFGPHCRVSNPPATTQYTPSASRKPNLFVMAPPDAQALFKEVFSRLKDNTSNKTGRFHSKMSYAGLFNGAYGRKPWDALVLLFSLETKDAIPAGYEDLLPRPWSEIEALLTEGKPVELKGKARELNVVLLAAPTQEQLTTLVHQSKLFRQIGPTPTQPALRR